MSDHQLSKPVGPVVIPYKDKHNQGGLVICNRINSSLQSFNLASATPFDCRKGFVRTKLIKRYEKEVVLPVEKIRELVGHLLKVGAHSVHITKYCS